MNHFASKLSETIDVDVGQGELDLVDSGSDQELQLAGGVIEADGDVAGQDRADVNDSLGGGREELEAVGVLLNVGIGVESSLQINDEVDSPALDILELGEFDD